MQSYCYESASLSWKPSSFWIVSSATPKPEVDHDAPAAVPCPADGRFALNPKRLKVCRSRLGMSQLGLAEYALDIRQPISIASIKRAELGKPVIYRTALRLAKILNVDLSTLVAS